LYSFAPKHEEVKTTTASVKSNARKCKDRQGELSLFHTMSLVRHLGYLALKNRKIGAKGLVNSLHQT
jgi:hypothetical protein